MTRDFRQYSQEYFEQIGSRTIDSQIASFRELPGKHRAFRFRLDFTGTNLGYLFSLFVTSDCYRGLWSSNSSNNRTLLWFRTKFYRNDITKITHVKYIRNYIGYPRGPIEEPITPNWIEATGFVRFTTRNSEVASIVSDFRRLDFDSLATIADRLEGTRECGDLPEAFRALYVPAG